MEDSYLFDWHRTKKYGRMQRADTHTSDRSSSSKEAGNCQVLAFILLPPAVLAAGLQAVKSFADFTSPSSTGEQGSSKGTGRHLSGPLSTLPTPSTCQNVETT